MRTLYFECRMGAAGDMLMASLLDLHPNPDQFLARLQNVGLPGVSLQLEEREKCGIIGKHVRVRIHGEEESSKDVFPAAGEKLPASPLHDPSHPQVSSHEQEHSPAHPHEHGHHHGHAHPHEHGHHHGHAHPHGHGHVHSPGHDHTHQTLQKIRQQIDTLDVSHQVKKDALAVYQRIAEAEAKAHQRPVEEVHFHEVGSLDAITDIVGVCLLLEELQPIRILASPIHVGSGHVHCAHGILPVPAPATAEILRGVPIYGGAITGELCTPTGAALLKHFVSAFGSMPMMRVQAIGYGMGTKDFAMANCVRAFLGESEDDSKSPISENPYSNASEASVVTELSCNLDDMTPEQIAFAQQQLLDAGALDVTTSPLSMKKGRPGLLLTCLCRVEEKETFLRLLFQHTTTLGLREQTYRRHTLARAVKTYETDQGPLRRKIAQGYGTTTEKWEYEDLARLAQARQASLLETKYWADSQRAVGKLSES